MSTEPSGAVVHTESRRHGAWVLCSGRGLRRENCIVLVVIALVVFEKPDRKLPASTSLPLPTATFRRCDSDTSKAVIGESLLSSINQRLRAFCKRTSVKNPFLAPASVHRWIFGTAAEARSYTRSMHTYPRRSAVSSARVRSTCALATQNCG